MTYDLVWMRTVAVPLRRVVLSRGLRRLLVLAGLVVAGWLLGGLASHAAHADTAPVQSGAVHGGEESRLKGVVRDVARTVSEKAGDAVAASQAPSKERPSGTAPVDEVVGGTLPIGDEASSGRPVEVDPVGAQPVPVREPVGAGREGTRAHPAAQHVKRHDAMRVVQRGGVLPPNGVVRSGSHAVPSNSAPAPAEPSVPVGTPGQQVGTLSGAAGPVLPGAGLGGHLGRWSWQSPPSAWAPVRAPRSIPAAVHTAVDEPSFSPD